MKYKDILKVEFKDSLAHFSSDREEFHMYRINRLLTNGSLIHFDYAYLPSEDSKKVLVELDLRTFGKIVFEIDTETSYGKILTEGYEGIIQRFIEEYDVFSEVKKA